MAIELRVPALGESVTQATVGTWLKKEGDTVQMDEPVVEVESEKATVALPAPAAGVLRRILKASGAEVAVGDVIGEVEEGAAAAAAPPSAARAPSPQASSGPSSSTAPAEPSRSRDSAPDRDERGQGFPAEPSRSRDLPSAAPAEPSQPRAPSSTAPAEPSQSRAPAPDRDETRSGVHRDETRSGVPRDERGQGSTARPALPSGPVPAPNDGHAPRGPVRAPPSVRRMMAENGLDAASLTGAAVVRRADVERAIVARERGAPSGEAPALRERAVPMSPLRRTVARRLLEAQQNAAILTTFNEIDMSRVIALREKHGEAFLQRHGVKLGFMSFFVKACVEALRAWPSVNAEIRGTEILYKDHYDIGVAVGGGKGLVVPVLRDADQLGFAEIEKRIGELSKRARENRITMQDLEGGTFTISNGGIYGSLLSTPILNPPQSGILGLHKIEKRAVVGPEDAIVARPMMYVALSYDHRLVDGREAVSFLVRVKECIEDPDRMLFEV
jgi:2-oxoglutarate dehydrogenase E2 component (dihydrolipoamide succinyltransferase)